VRNAKDYFADIPDLTPAPELLRLAASASVSALWRISFDL